MPVYVGDLLMVEGAETIDSALERINLSAKLCGFKLAREQAPAESISLLGASVALAREFVTAMFPDCNGQALVRDLEKVLRDGRLTPSQAAKLRGRLGSAQSLMFGNFGWAQLQPFPNRQYSRASKRPIL